MDHIDSDGVTTGSQVGAVDVEFLGIADDCPVRRHRISKHAEFHKGAEFTDHVQTLFHGGGMPGRFDVHVTTIPVGEMAHFADDVCLSGVEDQVRAAGAGDLQAVVVEVQGNKQAGVFEPGGGNHPQAQRSRAGDDHGVVQFDTAPLHGVNGARKRLDVHGVFGRNARGNLVVESVGWETHVSGHRTEGILPETVDIVPHAHPVLAAPAVAACVARDDLFGDRHVADSESVFLTGAGTEENDFANEFMAGDNGGLAVSLAVFISPEERGAQITFEIAGADPRGFDADHDLLRSRTRHGAFFQAVVFGSVADDSRHGFGKCGMRRQCHSPLKPTFGGPDIPRRQTSAGSSTT